MKRAPASDDTPRIIGVGAELPDEDEAYRRACDAWTKTERLLQRRESQRIEFERGPIAIVFAADLHLGSSGVDYPRVFEEAQTVVDTPGMYLMLVGDLLDNFILPKLMQARYNSEVMIAQEWALVRKYLKLVAPKLLVSVRGNHERFTFVLSGIDYFADVLRETQGKAIYDTDDVSLKLKVGTATCALRLRHQWRGNSIYNDTHSIERAARMDGGFAVGVGAHTHASGLVRTFNNHGLAGLAVLCGAYKRQDVYSREKGFHRPNPSTAMAVIFYENGAMVGVDRLDVAAELMEMYHKERKKK
jgi:hypothetical protein